MARLLAVWLAALVHLAVAQTNGKPWCSDGIRAPALADDGGQTSVQLYLAQAPLFSANPKIGNKMAWIRLFHTAIVLTQEVGGTLRNWTLEFDSVTNVLGASLPTINGNEMIWDNDARYCLTEGILWGEHHWSKTFKPVLRMTAAQTRAVFDDFVQHVNVSAHRTKPLYQLWRVVSHGWSPRTLIRDITCGDGIGWMLHYASAGLGLRLASDFEYKSTTVIVNAEEVAPVNVKDPAEWADVVNYFKGMSHVFAKGLTITQRLKAFWDVMPVKYVYDSNSGTYYRLMGNRFPWIWPEYTHAALAPPPWMAATGIPDPDEQQPSLVSVVV